MASWWVWFLMAGWWCGFMVAGWWVWFYGGRLVGVVLWWRVGVLY